MDKPEVSKSKDNLFISHQMYKEAVERGDDCITIKTERLRDLSSLALRGTQDRDMLALAFIDLMQSYLAVKHTEPVSPLPMRVFEHLLSFADRAISADTDSDIIEINSRSEPKTDQQAEQQSWVYLPQASNI